MNEFNHLERKHAIMSISASGRWLACPASIDATKKMRMHDFDDPLFRKVSEELCDETSKVYSERSFKSATDGTMAHEMSEKILRELIETNSIDAIKTFDDTTGKSDEYLDALKHSYGYAEYCHSLMQGASIFGVEEFLDVSNVIPEGFGTCDFFCVTDDTLHIVDLKYGRRLVSSTNNSQMMLYAIGVIKLAEDKKGKAFVDAIKKVSLHIYQPRIKNVSIYVLDIEELLDWAFNIVKPIAQDIHKGLMSEKFNAGEHCCYCPARHLCDARYDRVLGKFKEIKGDELDMVNVDKIDEALGLAGELATFLKDIKTVGMSCVKAGHKFNSVKLITGRHKRSFKDEKAVSKILENEGFMPEDFYKLQSVATIEKLLGAKRFRQLLLDQGNICSEPHEPQLVRRDERRYERATELGSDFFEE